ncbi:uncharacterized protein [Euwallacea fornicatus]
MERGSNLTSPTKRKHTKRSTQESVTFDQDKAQIPDTSISPAVATFAEGKKILPIFQCQREIISPTESPLHKRHKIQSDETSTSKLVIESYSSSDSASSPEEQKSPSPEPGTSARVHFNEDTEEVTEENEESREHLSTEQQQLDNPMMKPALLTQKASSSGNSRQPSSSSSNSAPEKLTCRLPINESTRAALTLYILVNQNVKEGEKSSDILDPLISDNRRQPVENLECHQIVHSSVPFDIPVIKGIEKSVDSILMPPPNMRIENITPPNQVRNDVVKENKRKSKLWWCIDSVTFYPLDQLHHRFRASYLANGIRWNITSYPRNLPSNQPGTLQFSSGSHDPRTLPPDVEPAEEDEEFVGRPNIRGTSKRVLGLVPHIGNINLTSILWTEPNPEEVFCRGIKRCKSCGMPQGLFTRLPITVKLLWYNSLDETEGPYTETVECAFPVDIWGTASLLKRQDSNVGWILDSKVLDVDLMLLKYAEAQDYGSEISESISAEGKSSERKTSESESSEGESSESEIV